MRQAITWVGFVVLATVGLVACGGSGGSSGGGTTPGGLSVREVSPSEGPTAGGTVVSIRGTGFSVGILRVVFGDVSATGVDVTSDSNLTCVTPAQASGVVSVFVTSVEDETASLPNGYGYARPPTILAVTPFAGPAGLTVSIVGFGFQQGGAGPPEVYFGDVRSPLPQVVNDTLIFATVPASPVGGILPVTVTNDNGSDTLPDAFFLWAGTR